MEIFKKKMYFWYETIVTSSHPVSLNTILVPLDFDEFQFVFLFLPLVLGDDDQVGVGTLEDVLTKNLASDINGYTFKRRNIFGKQKFS